MTRPDDDLVQRIAHELIQCGAPQIRPGDAVAVAVLVFGVAGDHSWAFTAKETGFDGLADRLQDAAGDLADDLLAERVADPAPPDGPWLELAAQREVEALIARLRRS